MKIFCPNCEKDTECEHTAELYECKECGEDFAKYIVKRNGNNDADLKREISKVVNEPSEFDCSVTENSILETRLADCESALKSMVEQYCYDGEILGKLYYCHDFMSAGENAFWYLVKYDLAEYVAGKKSKLTFKAQQAQGTVTVEDGYHEITGKQIYRPDEAIE